MALSSGFRNRISLEGDADVKARFAQVEKAGEQAFGGIRSAVEDSARGFLRFRGQLNSIPGSFSAVVSASAGLKTALAGAFALEGLGRVKEQFGEVLEGMRQLQNVSAGTGFAADAVKAFGQAVEQTGVVGEKVGPALVQYAGALADARTKADDLTVTTQGGVSVFRGFGQSLAEAANGVKDSTTGASDGLTRMRTALNDTATVGNSLVQVLRGGVLPSATELDTPFKVLGVDVRRFTKDAAGQAASLEAVARAFVKLKQTNPAAAIRAGALLFGEDDITKFSSALERIADVGLPKFKEEAQALGRLPTEEQQQALRQYDIAWANLRGTVEAALRPAITSILPALTTLLEGASSALEAVRKAFVDAGAATAVRAWADGLRSAVQPALADIATLITRTFDPNNVQPLRTDFAKNLVSGFQAARDTINLVIAAFRALIAVIDAALAPVNALFGTAFRADVLLGAAVLLKVTGVFGAITAAVSLARTALLAFTTIALRTPFGLLAAAVGIFIAKLTEGSETAQKFWASITGDSGEAAKAVGEAAAKTNDFGNAAQKAELSVSQALGVTQQLGTAATETGARFVRMAEAVPRMADGLPSVQRGIQEVSGAADNVRDRFHDVAAEAKTFRQEIEAAAKTAAKPLTKSATAADERRAGTAVGEQGKLERAATETVSAFSGVVEDLDNLLESSKALIAGDWAKAWEDASRVGTHALSDIRKEFPSLATAIENAAAEIKGIDWQKFFATGFDAAEAQTVDDVESIRIPLPKFIDDWIEGVRGRMAELNKLLHAPLTDPQFLGAAGEAPPPNFLSGWTEAVAKWNADTKAQIEANFAEIGPPPGSDLGSKLAAWARDALTRVTEAFKQLQLGAGPEFIGEWLPAVDRFGAEAKKDLSDDFRSLDVPAEPGFLAGWGTSIKTWLSGQVNEIKAAFSSISIPSPISSAQAATLPAVGAGAIAPAIASPTGDALGSTTQAIDDAASRLNDFIGAIPGAVSNALSQVSDLVVQALEQLNEFVTARAEALNEFVATAIQTVADLIASTIETMNAGFGAAFQALQDSFTTVSISINSQIQTIAVSLSNLADQAASVAAAVSGAVSSASDAIPGFAGGGQARGPGGPTGDKIPVYVSNEEFITQTAAVRHYGPRFFHLINQMRIPRDLIRQLLSGLQGFSLGGLADRVSQPVVNFSIPRFAQGGLVTAAAAADGAGKTTVPLVLDNKVFPALFDDDVAESLWRTARKAQMTKGGRRVKVGY